MKSAVLRESFLQYFADRGHARVPASSLAPADDPSLLFTNAGMVQFKDIFLGQRPPPYPRACSAQRCLRVGGKHNDLENVGYTARHHTLFEMLGNFSFGDYFKREASDYAWEFLTAPEGLDIDPRHLWITVFGGGTLFGAGGPELPPDLEAEDAWKECLSRAGFSPAALRQRIVRVPTLDNFWMMGDAGPCGPCSEIFYDHNPRARRFAGAKAAAADRCVEIWNLVFMQYQRSESGEMEPLPAPCIDTGMGLERMASALQGVQSNYENDLFSALLRCVDRAVVEYGGSGADGNYSASHRVVADHIRAAAFLVADGVAVANEGRGYVLRRIIRRAVRHTHRLGAAPGCFASLALPLVELMEEVFPLPAAQGARVEQLLHTEEEQFSHTLQQGLKILEHSLAELKRGQTLSGELLFRLYDSCGFPPDMSADVAREQGIGVDMDTFEARMEEQRQRARTASAFRERTALELPRLKEESRFTGYEELRTQTRVSGLWNVAGEPLQEIAAGERGMIALESTPFYAESGGQVGDSGLLLCADEPCFAVEDTLSSGTGRLHCGMGLGPLQLQQAVVAEVDAERRRAIMRHHSATHLLHAALRAVLGEQVQQRGSLVDAGRLRFDFTHHEALSDEQLLELERQVNGKILENTEVSVEWTSREEAERDGALALFGEKYGERVRVLRIGGDFSVELCGGTHVQRSGELGVFKIISESGIAAGVRRIEALAGAAALARFQDDARLLARLGAQLQQPPRDLPEKLQKLQEENRSLRRQLEKSADRAPGVELNIAAAVEVDGVRVLAQQLPARDPRGLRTAVDRCREQLGSGVVLLVSEYEGDAIFAAGISEDLVARLSAGKLMREFCASLGGRGGGRKDFAQGGGGDLSAVDAALERVPSWIAEQLG